MSNCYFPGSACCRHVQFFLKRGGLCPLLCHSKYSVVNRQTSVFVRMFTAGEKQVGKQPIDHFTCLFNVMSESTPLHTFLCCFCFHSSWKLRLITTESLWLFWKVFCQPSRHSKVILHVNKSSLLKAFPDKMAGWFLSVFFCPFKQTFPVRHKGNVPLGMQQISAWKTKQFPTHFSTEANDRTFNFYRSFFPFLFFFILSSADLHLTVTVAYCWTTEALILKTSLLFSPLSPPNVIKFSVLQALCLLFKIFDKRFFFFFFFPPLPLTPSKHMWSKPDKPGLPACGDDSRTPHTPTWVCVSFFSSSFLCLFICT